MRYWINNKPGNDKVIIWDGNKLYKANPKDYELREIEYLLKKNEIPESFFFIYKMQIRLVEMDESKKYICVYFGADSYEHFSISNQGIKKEIFEELGKTENVKVSVKELSLSERTKVQKKAFIVLSILFAIGFLFSYIIEQEKLPYGRYPAIILLIGSLGMKRVIIFYSLIISILGIKYYFVSRAKQVIHSIQFK